MTFQSFFNEDYEYFIQIQLPIERTIQEVDLIHRLAPTQVGGDVLDLGCGTGRISYELARRGARVRGIDSNAEFISRAIEQASLTGIDIEYRVADMQDPECYSGQFDLVILWSNTFGYFEDAINRWQLVEIFRCLRPSGVLLLDQHNRDWILRNWQDSILVHRGSDFFIDKNEFDLRTGRTINRRTFVRNDRVTGSARFGSRLFCPPELVGWLEASGFVDISVLGEDGRSLTLKHQRQVVRAARPAGGADRLD